MLDVTEPGAGAALVRELGEVNLFMRGVLHILDPYGRAAAVENMRAMLGARGVFYLSETNIEGDPIDHLVLQGATATSMPEPLRRCVAAGIRPPSHFGDRELGEHFPSERWQVLASGEIEMHTVALRSMPTETMPGYFAVLRGAPR